MAFIFPEDKADFLAPNGVTYSWDGTKWVTKTYNSAEPDARLPYRLGTDKAARSARVGDPAIELVDAQDNYSNVKFFGVNGIECESTIQGIKIDGHQLIGSGDIDLTKYATLDYSDAEDAKLQLQIDELGVTKGKVARYTTKSISGGFASRPGELAFNSSDPTAVNQISFGTEDSDNVLTKPMADGDIVEFVDALNSTVSRYKITDASGAPTGIEVEYISGDNTFVVGEEEQVYIYPQNESGATKEYVDEQDALRLPLTGGSLIGQLNTNSLIKSTRNTGYGLQLKPDDNEPITWLHTNGTFHFGGNGTINGNLDIETSSSTGVRILGSFKVKKDGELVGGANVFEVYGTYASYYGNITADNHIATKKYVDDNAGGGGGVELWGGDSPPPVSDRGTLLLTKSNALYIYTAT